MFINSGSQWSCHRSYISKQRLYNKQNRLHFFRQVRSQKFSIWSQGSWGDVSVPAGQWLVRCSVRSARHSKSCWQLSQVKMDSSSRSSSPTRSSWLVTLCSPSSPPARSFPSESRSGTAASAPKHTITKQKIQNASALPRVSFGVRIIWQKKELNRMQWSSWFSTSFRDNWNGDNSKNKSLLEKILKYLDLKEVFLLKVFPVFDNKLG